MLHCLIDLQQPMSRDEFKKFWEMIPKANESTVIVDQLYEGYLSGDIVSNIIEGFSKNGIVNLAKTAR